ncbi:hypothetical protein HK102_004991 [Quaeritorhiza haematococci]|nr:hypothetical protein HK102_004991 [Quaeritorhiza haematococci]
MHALKALLALAILAVTGSTLAAPTESHSEITPTLAPTDSDNNAIDSAPEEPQGENQVADELDVAGPGYGRGFRYGYRGFKKGRFPYYSNVIYAPRHKK